jgi:putative ABC transport system permease protein
MIGVFAVTLAVAVGSGAQVSVMESINALGSNMAIVFPQPDAEGGRSSFDRGRLTLRDARAIERTISGVSAIAPQLRPASRWSQVGGGRRRRRSVRLRDTAPSPGSARKAAGSSPKPTCGPAPASRCSGPPSRKAVRRFDPVGEAFRIDRVPFTVIGVLESKGSSFGNDNDDTIIVPITAARTRFSNSLPGRTTSTSFMSASTTAPT